MPVVHDVKVKWRSGINAKPRGEDGEILWMHNNRFTTSQVPTRRLDVVPRGHTNEFTELLADFDFLTRVNSELEILRSFKNQDDGATQAEPTHLLSGF